MIPISKPSIGKEELEKVRQVFDSCWLGMGSLVKEFEDSIGRFIGAKNVVAVNTGSSALHIALDTIGIKSGDEVITPSLTFAAAIQAITACGGIPVFCDVEEDTLNVDVESVKRLITKKTKAIMPVHYCGNPVNMNEILEIGRKNNIYIVEDAAHAFGSLYKGKRIGSFGDITCFSFDPVKVITCGEGGAVTTNNDEWADILRKKRLLGIDKDTWSRYKNWRSYIYDVVTQGYRYHLSNINAAIGIVQLQKVENFIKRRQEIVKRYDNAFLEIKEIEILKKEIKNIAPYCYIFKVKKDRDGLMKFLKECGIDTGIHYIPNHIQSVFRKYSRSLPITEKIWQEILTLPLYSDMKDEDVGLVIDSVKRYF